jgi:hypothetical protein
LSASTYKYVDNQKKQAKKKQAKKKQAKKKQAKKKQATPDDPVKAGAENGGRR